MEKKEPKLNMKQLAFVNEYVKNGGNGTQAYLSVYERVKSEEVAEAAASRMLSTVIVTDAIARRQALLSKISQIDANYIIKEYLELIESCKAEGLDGKGTIKDRQNWNKAVQSLSKMLGLDSPSQITPASQGITINIISPNAELPYVQQSINVTDASQIQITENKAQEEEE